MEQIVLYHSDNGHVAVTDTHKNTPCVWCGDTLHDDVGVTFTRYSSVSQYNASCCLKCAPDIFETANNADEHEPTLKRTRLNPVESRRHGVCILSNPIASDEAPCPYCSERTDVPGTYLELASGGGPHLRIHKTCWQDLAPRLSEAFQQAIENRSDEVLSELL